MNAHDPLLFGEGAASLAAAERRAKHSASLAGRLPSSQEEQA